MLEKLPKETAQLYFDIVRKIIVAEVEIDLRRVDDIADLLRPFVVDGELELAPLVVEILTTRLSFSRSMFGTYKL